MSPGNRSQTTATKTTNVCVNNSNPTSITPNLILNSMENVIEDVPFNIDKMQRNPNVRPGTSTVRAQPKVFTINGHANKQNDTMNDTKCCDAENKCNICFKVSLYSCFLLVIYSYK